MIIHDLKNDPEALLHILIDQSAAQGDRHWAATYLEQVTDQRVVDAFTRIAFDRDEDLEVRTRVVEVFPDVPSLLPVCLRMLEDDSPDMRFWAAYRLTWTWDTDLSPALDALDRIAAFNHRLPTHWGWHVDREALLPLEMIYSQPYQMCGIGEPAFSCRPGVWLISPQAEYGTFLYRYRRGREGGVYETQSYHPPEYTIDPSWLKQAISRRWRTAEFDVRQPKPRTYALDWHLTIYGKHLIGGLHRDGYGIVLTARKSFLIYRFAAWYRNAVKAPPPLYLYDWAGLGVELKAGWSAQEIRDAIRLLHQTADDEVMRLYANQQAGRSLPAS
ncbi:MAG: hypothetical protein IAE80_06660 [Anaerolinea sp.]|nr:hypothetical protein [Anaerolinea sp.]